MSTPPAILFAFNFGEVSILYSILYERQLCTPSKEEVLDEIERRELYPKGRHKISDALEAIDIMKDDMREYLVQFSGEPQVKELESRVEDMIRQARGEKT